MTNKYRKKPVVIEAKQFTALTIEQGEELASWCGGKLCGTALRPEDRVIKIDTLEGEMEASHGDWIIRGVKGEFYPCKPDVFAITYELALNAQPEVQADGCHCATCTCKPGMTPAVRFDTSPAEREGAVRDHLIRMGWTPPQQPEARVGGEAVAEWRFDALEVGSEDGLQAEVEVQESECPPTGDEVIFIDGVGAGRSSVKSCHDGVQWIRVGNRVYWPLSDSDAKRLQSACCGNGSFDGPTTPADEALLRQALEALEILRDGLLQMEGHAEDYGKRWAAAYIKELRDLSPGSAEEKFDLLGILQDRLAAVSMGVRKGYAAIIALRERLVKGEQQ